MEQKAKVLLIDDDEGFCFFVRKKLNDTGYFEVLTASKGTEGLELARTQWPDIILIDIVMPDLSGEEVAEKLNNQPETMDIPKIFLTALAADEEPDIGVLKKIKGSHFIAKPLRPKDLMMAIRNILGKK